MTKCQSTLRIKGKLQVAWATETGTKKSSLASGKYLLLSVVCTSSLYSMATALENKGKLVVPGKRAKIWKWWKSASSTWISLWAQTTACRNEYGPEQNRRMKTFLQKGWHQRMRPFNVFCDTDSLGLEICFPVLAQLQTVTDRSLIPCVSLLCSGASTVLLGQTRSALLQIIWFSSTVVVRVTLGDYPVSFLCFLSVSLRRTLTKAVQTRGQTHVVGTQVLQSIASPFCPQHDALYHR